MLLASISAEADKVDQRRGKSSVVGGVSGLILLSLCDVLLASIRAAEADRVDQRRGKSSAVKGVLGLIALIHYTMCYLI